MGVTIRFAGPGDAETLFRFIVELAEYEREPDAVEVTAADLRAQLSAATPPFECLLAEQDGAACGFALFFHTYSTWRGRQGIYLEDLYVPEVSRGAGVGAALLATLAGLAQDRDCARVEWAVLNWNTPAIGFYERIGARPQADWQVYRLTDGALATLASSAPNISASTSTTTRSPTSTSAKR